MAQCTYCNKKGFFVTVNAMKLCNTCNSPISTCISRHFDIIQESSLIVESSKNLSTRMSRIDVIIDNLETLENEYAAKGIPLNLDFHSRKREILNIKSNILEEDAVIKVDDFIKKASLAKTVASKINIANKALMYLKDLVDNYDYINKELGIKVLKFIHISQLDDLVLKAEKEEFKSNYKKAVDKYQDVLFYLKKDDIDDSLQVEEIKKYEDKVAHLSSLK